MGFIRVGIISFYLGFKNRGFWPTIKMFLEALIDEVYNRRSGLDFSSFYDPKESPKDFKHKANANYYQPLRVRPFKALLQKIDVDTGGRFVDIGTGKAKPLFMAYEFGFKKLIGVEVVPELCDVAKSNIKKYHMQNKGKDAQFEIHTLSGGDYQLNGEDQFILLNDPFDNEIMALFVKNMLNGLKSQQRSKPLWIVYKNNNQRDMPSLEAFKKVGEYFEYDFAGNFFQVYKLQ